MDWKLTKDCKEQVDEVVRRAKSLADHPIPASIFSGAMLDEGVKEAEEHFTGLGKKDPLLVVVKALADFFYSTVKGDATEASVLAFLITLRLAGIIDTPKPVSAYPLKDLMEMVQAEVPKEVKTSIRVIPVPEEVGEMIGELLKGIKDGKKHTTH